MFFCDSVDAVDEADDVVVVAGVGEGGEAVGQVNVHSGLDQSQSQQTFS